MTRSAAFKTADRLEPDMALVKKEANRPAREYEKLRDYFPTRTDAIGVSLVQLFGRGTRKSPLEAWAGPTTPGFMSNRYQCASLTEANRFPARGIGSHSNRETPVFEYFQSATLSLDQIIFQEPILSTQKHLLSPFEPSTPFHFFQMGQPDENLSTLTPAEKRYNELSSQRYQRQLTVEEKDELTRLEDDLDQQDSQDPSLVDFAKHLQKGYSKLDDGLMRINKIIDELLNA